MSGADVLVESGAALVVQNNTATSRYGAACTKRGSTFTPPQQHARHCPEQYGRKRRRRCTQCLVLTCWSAERRSSFKQHGHKRCQAACTF